MAILNAIQEGYRVTVGSVDCTASLKGSQWLSLTRSNISDGGLCLTTGSLSLLPVDGFAPNFFSPRRNPQQWQRGTGVTIEIEFSGTFYRLFTGFILAPPATPSRADGSLVVEIGCAIALRNKEAPAGDRAGVILGTFKTRTEIIASIATASGWAAAELDIAIAEYPVNYPCPMTSGGFVQQMGAIAASAAYVLDSSPAGLLRSSQLGIEPVSYLIERTDCDSLLEPVDGSEDPSAKVRAIAVGREVSESPLVNKWVDEEQGTLINRARYSIQAGYQGRLIIEGIRKRTTYCEVWSPDYKTLTTTETVELPDIDIESESYTLFVRRLTENIYSYSSAKDGKLLKREETVKQPPDYLGIAFSPFKTEETPALVISEKTTEEWAYDGELPSRQSTTSFGLTVRTFNGFTTSFDEGVLRGVDVIEWEPLQGDRWRKRESFYRPTETDEDDPNTLEDTGTVKTFIGEKYRPPSPERHIPTDSNDGIEYSSIVCFDGVGVADEEPLIYEFEYGVSEEQAEQLAQLHGAILIGRHRTWQCSVEFSQEWLGYRPGACVRLTLPDGDIIAGMIDGVSFNFSRAEGLVTFGVIDLGTVGYDPYERPVGQVIGGAAPPASPAPTFTALQPPYIPVESAITGFVLGADGDEFLDDQTDGAEAGFVLGADGDDPEQEIGAEAGFVLGADGDDTGELLPGPLAVAEGGTGAITPEGARHNLGLSVAGGDLTEFYPSPTVRDRAITFVKFQEINGQRLLGNAAAAAGAVNEIALGAGLEFDGGVLKSTGGGHAIADTTQTYPQRSTLRFEGGVTVADDQSNDVTIVSVSGSAGGAGSTKGIVASGSFSDNGTTLTTYNLHNVTSVARATTGRWTVTLSEAQPNDKFPCGASYSPQSGASQNYSTGAYPTSTTTFTIERESSNGVGSNLGGSVLSFWVVGDVNAFGSGNITMLEQIELTANAAFVEFSSIPQTYKHLQVKGRAKTDRASSSADGIDVTFNGDTSGSNYVRQVIDALNSSISTNSLTNASNARSAFAGSATGAPSNEFSSIDGSILFYSDTTKLKRVTGRSEFLRSSSDMQISDRTVSWLNTNAITLVRLTPSFGTNFMAGTIFELYGI